MWTVITKHAKNSWQASCRELVWTCAALNRSQVLMFVKIKKNKKILIIFYTNAHSYMPNLLSGATTEGKSSHFKSTMSESEARDATTWSTSEQQPINLNWDYVNFICKNKSNKIPVFRFMYAAYHRFTLNTTVSTPASALLRVKREEIVIFLINSTQGWQTILILPTEYSISHNLSLNQFCKNSHREKGDNNYHIGQLKVSQFSTAH